MPDKNGNENCLEGWECPECGQHERFCVMATMKVELTEAGTDAYAHGLNGGTEYDGNSPVRCPECNHHGKVKDFCVHWED